MSTTAFRSHILRKRLKRVTTSVLDAFLSQFMDTKKLKSQERIVNEIVSHYALMENNDDFLVKFNRFVRDYLLSAKESCYLIKIPTPYDLKNWVLEWENTEFQAENHNFFFHVHMDLEERILDVGKYSISFPTEAIFLIATSQETKTELSGTKTVERYITNELEIIFRGKTDVIEIRGAFQVARDFINSVAQEQDTPLREAKSIFVGELGDKINAIAAPIRVVPFDNLKTALNGEYLSMSAPISGSKTHRIKADFEELGFIEQETDKELQPILHRLMDHQDKSHIAFRYRDKKYSFHITKSGGLYFRKYTPEEPLTYVLAKILEPSLHSLNQPETHQETHDVTPSKEYKEHKSSFPEEEKGSLILDQIREYILQRKDHGGLIGISDIAEYCKQPVGSILLNLIELKSLGEVEIIKRHYCPEYHLFSEEEIPYCSECEITYGQGFIVTEVYVKSTDSAVNSSRKRIMVASGGS